jgi:hypothetical protein
MDLRTFRRNGPGLAECESEAARRRLWGDRRAHRSLDTRGPVSNVAASWPQFGYRGQTHSTLCAARAGKVSGHGASLRRAYRDGRGDAMTAVGEAYRRACGLPGDQHRDHPPARSSRRRGLRKIRPQGCGDDRRHHGDVRIRPNRPGPSRTERRLEIDTRRRTAHREAQPVPSATRQARYRTAVPAVGRLAVGIAGRRLDQLRARESAGMRCPQRSRREKG